MGQCQRCQTACGKSIVCGACASDIQAQAATLVARFSDETGICGVCGRVVSDPRHRYCSDDHRVVAIIARDLMTGRSWATWNHPTYQGYLADPAMPVTLRESPLPRASAVVSPPPVLVVVQSPDESEGQMMRRCAGRDDTHLPMWLPLAFFAAGQHQCTVCQSAYNAAYRVKEGAAIKEQKRLAYQAHRQETLERVQRNREARRLDELAERKQRWEDRVAHQREQEQGDPHGCQGTCLHPDACTAHCQTLTAYKQSITTATTKGAHWLAEHGYHPSVKLPVGYIRQEVELLTTSTQSKRSFRRRYAARVIKDEAVAERVSLAWEMKYEGATLREIHEATGLYDLSANRKAPYSSYTSMFTRSLYAGILSYGGTWYPLDWEAGARFCDPYIDLDRWQAIQDRREERDAYVRELGR